MFNISRCPSTAVLWYEALNVIRHLWRAKKSIRPTQNADDRSPGRYIVFSPGSRTLPNSLLYLLHMMKNIAKNNRVYVIANLSTNHEGNAKLACELIETAAVSHNI
ncbi:hypothetical protein ACI65C_000866 [Semiaphis heraclei]